MKKPLLNGLLSALLVLMCLICLPRDARAASAVVTGGSCGTGVKWTLYESGTLNISGSGAMEDYDSFFDAPWWDYKGSINKIIVRSGITAIGDRAFCDTYQLTSVTIGDTVSRIGDRAFYGCYVEKYVTDSASKHFSADDSGVLYNKSKTTLINAPRAISGSYRIPDTVTAIADYAFVDCRKLTAVTIGDKVATIGAEAFAYCSSLKDVTFGSSVSVIKEYAFYRCGALSALRLPDGLTRIDAYAFGSCAKVPSLRLPENVTTFDITAIDDCTGINGIWVDSDNTVYSSDDDGILFNKSKTTLLRAPLSLSGHYRIPGTVTMIGESAFFRCTGMTGITISEGVRVIGKDAFDSCIGITAITIPDTVTDLQAGAFSNCDGLTAVTLPSSITAVADSLFYTCDSLRSVQLPATITSIGCDSFGFCGKLTQIALPKTVKSIDADAFYGCTALQWISFLGNAPTIGDYAFGQVTATAYHPSGNSSYTSDFKSGYGGSLSWKTFQKVTITRQPQDVKAPTDSKISTGVTASGDGLTYQWYVKLVTGSKFTRSSITAATYSVTATEEFVDRQVYCVVTDRYGNSVTSNTVTLSRNGTVQILQHPTDTRIPVGSYASTTVIAGGDGLTYQWYVKDPDSSKYVRSSITGPTYRVRMTKENAGRQVYCVVKDRYGNSKFSRAVVLRRGYAAEITAQPTTMVVQEGQIAKATVSATGDGLTYQWYFAERGSDRFAATSAFTTGTYQITMTDARAGRRVYCVISDAYGNSVKTDTVTLSMPVKILRHPTSVSALQGTVAKVSVWAQGDGLTFKWYYANRGESKYTRTTAFGGNSYSIVMDSSKHGRQVYCVVSDKYGNSVYTRAVVLRLGTALKITSQPVSVAVPDGQTAKVTVGVVGDGLTYKWYYANRGSNTFTYTSSFGSNTYSIPMSASKMGRRVYCVITDQYGNSVTTDTVTLSMAVKITSQPKDAAAYDGKTAKAVVQAQGDQLTYKWYYANKGSDKFTYTSSITSNTYKITMNDVRSGRRVYCVITDKYGNSVQSKTVTLSLRTPLKITSQPKDTAALWGDTAKVTVKVQGDGLTYKWYYANSGSDKFTRTKSFTTGTYKITMDDIRSGRRVYCVITDRYGDSVKTNVVTLSLKTPLKLLWQVSSAGAVYEATVSASIGVQGDGLEFHWYYCDPGTDYYVYDTENHTSTYSVTMTFPRAGRKVYCVITDKYGDSVQTKPILLIME